MKLFENKQHYFDMSKKITYTTDVAHCGGEDCAIRKNCVRYRLFCMWIKRPYKFVSFVEFPAYNSKTEQCEMFKPVE